jgi:hypothetical protein
VIVCFGTGRNRRVGLHRYGKIGRATQYGRRVLQIVMCIHCDKASVIG